MKRTSFFNLPEPVRAALIWAGLAVAVTLPLALAAQSPLLQWREPIYIAAGFAGALAMALLLLQPLFAMARLPGLPLRPSRAIHRWIGGLLVLAILVHVAGLWITSPPDVIDALTFTSPTPFSAWGVIAMWALFAAAVVALRLNRPPGAGRRLRSIHVGLVIVTVIGSVIHALLIEGTMEPMSKAILCVLVLLAAASAAARHFGFLSRAR